MTESSTQGSPDIGSVATGPAGGEAPPEPLHHRVFRHRSLRASRFIDSDLGEVVVRGSDIGGMDLDDPWLLEDADGPAVVVNGVDVRPLVDAELNRRFPGRELRHGSHPQELREAWAAVESTWSATVARAEGMHASARDASVDGEWSFTQTLRHLVLATDVWLGRAILRRERPYHPFGLPNDEGGSLAWTDADFSPVTPTWPQVLDARADRLQQVREFLAATTDDQLAEPRVNPHDGEHPETVLRCLHTILAEEWEHHRYAVRDLDRLASGSPPAAASSDQHPSGSESQSID